MVDPSGTSNENRLNALISFSDPGVKTTSMGMPLFALASPHFSYALQKSAPSVSRSIQETLLKRFTNLSYESLLGASQNILHAFSQVS